MTCDFSSFLATFQSYHEDGKMQMKGCVQRISVYSWKYFRLQRVWNASERSTHENAKKLAPSVDLQRAQRDK